MKPVRILNLFYYFSIELYLRITIFSRVIDLIGHSCYSGGKILPGDDDNEGQLQLHRMQKASEPFTRKQRGSGHCRVHWNTSFMLQDTDADASQLYHRREQVLRWYRTDILRWQSHQTARRRLCTMRFLSASRIATMRQRITRPRPYKVWHFLFKSTKYSDFKQSTTIGRFSRAS